MKTVTRIKFDSREESNKFKQIIISSNDPNEAIERVKGSLNVTASMAVTAVTIFWKNRDSYLTRFKKE